MTLDAIQARALAARTRNFMAAYRAEDTRLSAVRSWEQDRSEAKRLCDEMAHAGDLAVSFDYERHIRPIIWGL